MTKRALIFRILMFLYIAALAYLLFAKVGGANIPKELFGWEGDKFLHFCLFFPFPVLALLTLKNLPEGFWATTFVMGAIFLAGCGLAGLTELIQDIIPYREANWGDYRADVYSTTLCSFLSYIVKLSIPARKKRKK